MRARIQGRLNAMEAWTGRVLCDKATTEEAFLHVYRRGPRVDFALAVTRFWWGRRTGRGLAGVFVAVNELAGRHVLPAFRSAAPPRLTPGQLETVAQRFTARRPLDR